MVSGIGKIPAAILGLTGIFDFIFGDTTMPAWPGPLAMRNYGSGGSGGGGLMAVPEPGSAVVAMLLLCVFAGSGRRRALV